MSDLSHGAGDTNTDTTNGGTSEQTSAGARVNESGSVSSVVPPAVRQRIASLVGLHNQGATCYLNSLLQALYMTPPFRRMVFAWRPPQSANDMHAGDGNGTDGGAGTGAAAALGALKRSVPYQLQLLFARLALSRTRQAVDTAALTHAFGWSNAENFRQHDVQELMRVLFSALELAWGAPASSGTSLPAPASDGGAPTLASLYTGRLLDAVECCNCGARRERTDLFQDLSLGVSGCPTLHDSLKAFVAPEKLEGDNALRCSSDKCGGTKQPALKGLSLLSPLPAILTFQLKRFLFDFKLLQRVKLNDAFDFPQRIDMSEFLAKRPDDATAAVPAGTSASPSTVYELFAILMHSGVALGGHYYAYLRCPDGSFHEFNDAQVWSLDNGVEGAIKHARGGQDGQSGASAYMLMYRRVDDEKKSGAEPSSADTAVAAAESSVEVLLSDEVRALIAAEEAQYEADQKQAEIERRTMHLTVHFQPNGAADAGATTAAASSTGAVAKPAEAAPLQTATFRLDCGTPLVLLLQQLRESFPSLSPSTPLPLLRLRKFEPSLCWASTIYGDGAAAEELTLEKAGLQKQNNLILEQRKDGEEWMAYLPDTVPLRCVFVTPANVTTLVEQSLHPMVTPDVFVASVSKSGSVAALRNAVIAGATAWAAPTQAIPAADNLRLVLLHESHTQLLKDDPASPAPSLHGFDLYPGRWLYVEHAREEELLRPTFELLRCQIEICFNEPAELSASSTSSAALDAGPVFQPAYTRSVHASKNETLATLKARIGAALGLDVGEFRVARSHTAPQFKDMDQTLGRMQLVDQSGIFVSKGRPLEKDEVLVKFFLYAEEDLLPADPAAAEAAAVAASAAPASAAPSRFLPLFDLPIRVDTPISELKRSALGYLSRLRPGRSAGSNGWGIEHVRVREKKGAASKAVLEDGKTLAENVGPHGLEDGLELALQRLEQEEVWTKDSMLLQLQRWMPRTQKLGPVEDFVVRKNISVGTTKAQISRMLHPNSPVPAKPDSAAAPPSTASSESAPASAATVPSSTPPPSRPIFLSKGKLVGRMKRADVAKLTWLGGDDSSADSKLLRNALALRSGELLLFYEGLTEAEQAALQAAKEKKAAAAAAAAAEAGGASAADGAPPAGKAGAVTAASSALKPWQRGAAARVRKAAGVTGVAVPARAAPVEHALRIGLTPEEEAAAAREDEKAAKAAAEVAAAAAPTDASKT